MALVPGMVLPAGLWNDLLHLLQIRYQAPHPCVQAHHDGPKINWLFDIVLSCAFWPSRCNPYAFLFFLALKQQVMLTENANAQINLNNC